MADGGKVVIKIDGDAKPFGKAFKGVESDVKSFAGGVAKAFTVVGAATTAVAGYAVKVGKEFESQMSTAGAISEAAADDMALLTDKAKEMGIKTQFSATEAGKAMEYMAMAGWKTADMLGGVEGIMNLAAASGEDLATTADIVTDALTAFGLAADQSGRFADVLAAASSNSNTNVAMMGETFKYVAPVAGAMKFSIEDTAVAIGLMANAGIKASNAGTALRSIFTRLAKPPKEAAAAIGELGLEIANADGSIKPLNNILGQMREKFSKLNDQQKIQMATSIAGKNAMSGLLAIVNASDTDFNKLTKSINESTGAAEKMADIRLDNLDGQITLLKSSAEGAGIALYDKLSKPLTGFVKNELIPTLNEITNAINTGSFELAAQKIGGIFSSITKKIIDIAPTIANTAMQIGSQIAQGIGLGFAEKFPEYSNVIMAIIPTLKTLLEVILAYKAISTVTSVIQGLGAALSSLSMGNAILLGLAAGITLVKFYSELQNTVPGAAAEIAKFSDDLSKQKQKVKELTGASKNLHKTFEDSTAGAEAEAFAQKKLVDELDALSQKQDKTAEDKQRIADLSSQINGYLGEEAVKYDKQTGAITQTKDALYKLIEAKMKNAQAEAFSEYYTEKLKNNYQTIGEITTARQKLNDVTAEYQDLAAKGDSRTDSQNARFAALGQVIDEYRTNLQNLVGNYKTSWSEIEAAAKAAGVKLPETFKQTMFEMNTAFDTSGNKVAQKLNEAFKAGEIDTSGFQAKGVEAKNSFMAGFLADTFGGGAFHDYSWMGDSMNSQAAKDAQSYSETFNSAVHIQIPETAIDSTAIDGSSSAAAAQNYSDAFSQNVNIKIPESAVDGSSLSGTASGSAQSYAEAFSSTVHILIPAAAVDGSAVNSSASANGAEYKANYEAGMGTTSVGNQFFSSVNSAGAQSASWGSGKGSDYGAGYVSGINSHAAAAYAAGYNLGVQAKQGTAAGQKSASPSKEAIKLGKYFGEGYALGITKMSSKVYNVSKDLAKRAIQAIKDIGKDERTNVERVWDEINEPKLESEIFYEKEKERLAKSSSDADKKYLEQLKENADAERKLYDALKKDITDTKDAIVDAFEEMADAAFDSIEDLADAKSDLADSLRDLGADYAVAEEFTGNDLFPSFTRYTLDVLDNSIERINDFGDSLINLKKRGLPTELFKQIREMPKKEAEEYVKALSQATDKEFDAYVSKWIERNKAISKVTDMLYEDESKEIYDNFMSVFYKSPEEFFGIGEDSARLFGEGFMSKLDSAFSDFRLAFNVRFGEVSGMPTYGMDRDEINQTVNVYAPETNAHSIVKEFERNMQYTKQKGGF